MDDALEGAVIHVHVNLADAGEDDGDLAGAFCVVVDLVDFALAGPVFGKPRVEAVMGVLAGRIVFPMDADIPVV